MNTLAARQIRTRCSSRDAQALQSTQSGARKAQEIRFQILGGSAPSKHPQRKQTWTDNRGLVGDVMEPLECRTNELETLEAFGPIRSQPNALTAQPTSQHSWRNATSSSSALLVPALFCTYQPTAVVQAHTLCTLLSMAKIRCEPCPSTNKLYHSTGGPFKSLRFSVLCLTPSPHSSCTPHDAAWLQGGGFCAAGTRRLPHSAVTRQHGLDTGCSRSYK